MAREMKDSGIDWIGEIPRKWDLVKTKHCYSNQKVIVGENADEYERLALTLNGVIKRSKYDSTGLQPEAFNGYQILHKNELVFKLIDLENISTSRVGYSPYTGIVSPAYIVLHPNERKESRFGEYYFLSMWQREIFNHMGDDGVRSSLNAKDLMDTPYLRIPSSEKEIIVSFLDNQCTHIDSVIEKTRATIEEYKKLKQSVITKAVTKGIRTNREMKDCGIEWIGKIPAEWRLSKIKVGVTKVGSGKTPSGGADVYSDKGVLFLRSQNIYDTGLILNPPTYITSEIHEEMKNTRVVPNDVLLNITGGSIGRCCIFLSEFAEANVNQHVSIIRVIKDIIIPEFMHLYWISYLGKMSIQLYQTGGNREGMTAEAIKNSPIPIPSIPEQSEIVAYLDEKTAAIDSLIQKKEQLITELEAYKKSLIYEYVTGKKEIPT